MTNEFVLNRDRRLIAIIAASNHRTRQRISCYCEKQDAAAQETRYPFL
jgi:hypothetical protein